MMINATVSILNSSETHNVTLQNIRFSEREVEIIYYLIQRMASKEIASILDISHNTVRNHINNICGKIGCSSRRGIIDYVQKTKNNIFLYKNLRNDFVLLKEYKFNQRKLMLIVILLLIAIISVLTYKEFI